MSEIYCTELTCRGLLRLAGEDARGFLNGLVTCDIDKLDAGDVAFGALLSPQGKILFDFFVIASLNGFILDVDRSMLDDLARRLTFYRLRAKVDIEPMDERTHVFTLWSKEAGPDAVVADGVVARDPRLGAMGLRAYVRRMPPDTKPATCDQWRQHRIALGMPSGGRDFIYGDAFPHDALMDQFNGVDFKKGCFVGQEVVSRVQHRKSARKRVIMVAADRPLPASGAEILVDGRAVGELTSVSGSSGLAMVRLDRAAPHAQGAAASAGALPVRLAIQPWCHFDWPREG
ncbi:MAG: folate-binding protein YgfZ [Nitratireductor sp.]|nr:folate-binding protein YgfZ [Nitratireductor sp.]